MKRPRSRMEGLLSEIYDGFTLDFTENGSKVEKHPSVLV